MHERLAATNAPCSTRPAPVDEDTKKPCPKTLWLLASSERPVGPGEGILQRLLGILPIAQHVHRVPGVSVAIARNQRAIRVHLTVQHSRDELRIRALHTLKTRH